MVYGTGVVGCRHSLIDDPASPNKNKILEPLRASRNRRRCLLNPEGIGSEAGELSEPVESAGNCSHLLVRGADLFDIQMPKMLRRCRAFFVVEETVVDILGRGVLRKRKDSGCQIWTKLVKAGEIV